MMQKVNNDYQFICAKLIKGGNYSAEQTESEIKFSKEYADVINAEITKANTALTKSKVNTVQPD